MKYSDFDPYQELIDLKDFAQATHKHLIDLTRNQQQIAEGVNHLSTEIDKLKNTIKYYKKKIQEIQNENANKE